MAERIIELIPRAEGVREASQPEPPTQFSLSEIKQHFESSLDAVKAQYSVADSLAANGDLVGCKTIWRSQVVFAEGLLDFYIHEISKYCMFRMFTGSWGKSEKYENFPVPMSRVEEAVTSRSRDWFFEYLNTKFARDVYLSKEMMKEQLNLIGLDFSTVMGKAFPRSKLEISVKDGGTIVSDLFKRRNEIAHQNDRSHASAEQADITKEYVEDYIGKIESIVSAIQETAVEKG